LFEQKQGFSRSLIRTTGRDLARAGEACLADTRGGWTCLDLIRRLELLPGLAVNTYLRLAAGAQSQRSYLLTKLYAGLAFLSDHPLLIVTLLVFIISTVERDLVEVQR
jgi:hypothetical protein